MQKLGIAASVFGLIGLALITASVTNLYRTSPSWPVWVDIVSFTTGAILLGDLIVAAMVMLISRKSDSPPPPITLDVALVQTAQQSQTVVVHTEPAGSQDSLIRYWMGRPQSLGDGFLERQAGIDRVTQAFEARRAVVISVAQALARPASLPSSPTRWTVTDSGAQQAPTSIRLWLLCPRT